MKALRLPSLITLLLFFNILNSQAQVQIGQDIDGEAAGDSSGYSISMPDSYTIAIGSPSNDGNGILSGQVRVYEWNANSWVQKGNDIDGESAYDESGWAVSMPDANTVAVGAPENDGNGNGRGQVRVYEWSGSSWIQKGSDIDGAADFDDFGFSVHMSDPNTVAVGGINHDVNVNNDNIGHVRIFKWTGSSWQQKGNDLDGVANGERFGYSIEMADSNHIAIGAWANDQNGTNAGAARMYNWNGSSWVQKGLDLYGDASFDLFGCDISMPTPNTVAIGAYLNDGNGNDAGQAKVFAWFNGAWVQFGSYITGEQSTDWSAYSISMPDSISIGIGSPFGLSSNNASSGHTRVFRWNNSWQQDGNNIDGENSSDYAGGSVCMPNSTTIAIGSHRNSDNGTEAGQVRVYRYCTNTSSNISPTACGSYTSPSTKYTFTSSGTYQDTIPNDMGCDSIITINLSINTVDTAITKSHTTITATVSGASYQWLNCDSSLAPIQGETGQTFVAVKNGNYAVEITENGCIDTSRCVAVTSVSISENDLDQNLKIYPNPTQGKVFIELGETASSLTATVRNALGQVIYREDLNGVKQFDLDLEGERGLYFIELINSQGKKAVMQLMKE